MFIRLFAGFFFNKVVAARIFNTPPLFNIFVSTDNLQFMNETNILNIFKNVEFIDTHHVW